MKTLICRYCGCSLVRLGISKEKAAKHSYDGSEYHFYCQDCADEFAADPEQHLQRTKDLIVCPTYLVFVVSTFLFGVNIWLFKRGYKIKT